MFVTRVLGTGLPLIVAASCSAGSAPEAQTEYQDSSGVRIAVSDLRDLTALPVCRAEPPDMRLGSVSGDGPEVFHQIEDVQRLPDSGFAVLDRGDHVVRLFAPDGRSRGTFGGDGDGPGEFRDPIEIELLGQDSIAVWDWQLGRVSVFDLSGSLGRTIRLTPPAQNPTGYFNVVGDEPYFVVGVEGVQPFFGNQLALQDLHILRYDARGILLDTIATLPYGHKGWVDAGARRSGRPLFEPRSVFSAGRSSVYLSTAADPQVTILEPGGTVRSLVRWHAPARDVTDADASMYKARWLDRTVEHLRPLLERRFEVMPVREQFPAVQGIEVDEIGRLWVKTYDRPGLIEQTWLAFDTSGRFTCSLRLPRGFTVLDFRDSHVTGTVLDDVDVQYVVSRRIIVPG